LVSSTNSFCCSTSAGLRLRDFGAAPASRAGAAAGLPAAGLSSRATTERGGRCGGFGGRLERLQQRRGLFGPATARARSRFSCAGAATARSGAAVFAASVIGWATLAGP
jgi:hypothetical protein